MTTAEVAGTITLVGTGVSVSALVYLHVAKTGLSPVRQAVSQYGITPYRAWYRVQTIAMGLAAAALAVAMDATFLHVPHRSFGTLRSSQIGPAAQQVWGHDATQVVVLVALTAVSRLVISWFPMDEPGSPRTSTGAAHGILAIVAFVSVGAAAVRLPKVLEPVALYDRLGDASRVLGWLMVACVVLMFLVRLAVDLRRYFGLIERALYLAIVAWLVVLGVAFATGHLTSTPSGWLPCRHGDVIFGAGLCPG